METNSSDVGATSAPPPPPPHSQSTVSSADDSIEHEGQTDGVEDESSGYGAKVPTDQPEEQLAAGARTSRFRRWRDELAALKPYVVVTTTYLLFSLTDGGIRMVVLLYSISLGFSALATALMFASYELSGVVTNILAGMIGSAWGIRTPLLIGLGFQTVSLGMLFVWQAEQSVLHNVHGAIYVAAAQVLSGAAKDMVKLSGKSISRLVTPESKQTRLFRLVAFITGFKNTFKGLGYILGAGLVQVSYYGVLAALLGIIGVTVPIVLWGLDWDTGRVPRDYVSLRRMLTVNHNVGFLCLARVFLFGTRDLWLEVPILYFLQNGVYGFGWPDYAVGLFVGIYTIVYGQVQSWAPQYLLRPLGQMPANRYTTLFWTLWLFPITFLIGGILQWSPQFADRDLGSMISFVLIMVMVFSCVFAVNSSVHSYLIVKYTAGDKVAMTVGFYYMTNAVGRFVGTIGGGALYTFVSSNRVVSLASCFWVSLGFIVLAELFTIFLRDNQGGFQCGRCIRYGVDDASTPTDTRKDATAADKPSVESDIDKDVEKAQSEAAVNKEA
ncbi:hypothetical protein CDCA_CDCA15G4067 [Cyanidium caldarium]|uniref:Uncharacterized protein n=1 Tax=Cyanidium caldarium TaxID=2771 RepID=A0AAV9J0F4_CYACA|nr:hypothetical protein CDCA_CDCA15G4067 [Cyanidium caldarium]